LAANWAPKLSTLKKKKSAPWDAVQELLPLLQNSVT
jgi:hypothetical protein